MAQFGRAGTPQDPADSAERQERVVVDGRHLGWLRLLVGSSRTVLAESGTEFGKGRAGVAAREAVVAARHWSR